MRHLFKTNYFNEFEIDFSSQLLVFYGENNSGKTELLNLIKKQFDKKQLILHIEDKELNESIFVDELPDFQNEIKLSKKSILRGRIKKLLINEFDNNDVSLSQEINQIFSKYKIDNKLFEILNVKTQDYQLSYKDNADSVDDFIDYFFEIQSLDLKENEKEETTLSLSSMKKLYYELLLFSKKDVENCLILLDCPETLYDKSSIEWLANKVKKLSEKNYVVLTSKESKFLEVLELDIKQYYFIGNKLIERFLFKENSFILSRAIIDYEKSNYNNFDLFFSNVSLVFYDEDIKKANSLFFKIFVSFLDKINLKEKIINLFSLNKDFFNDQYFLIIKIFAKDNNFKILNDLKLNYKSLIEIDL